MRESIFNSLYSFGAIDGARVLDAFCGSGALGIEALSRGAAHATFVDAERRAVDVTTGNLAGAGLADRATVVLADVSAHLAAHQGTSYDLVLLDPPYEFDGWDDLLSLVDAGFVVVESDRCVEGPRRWRVVRQKRYGGTVVTMLRPDPEPS